MTGSWKEMPLNEIKLYKLTKSVYFILKFIKAW